jgi:LacI family transcriptional regulator
VTRVPPLGVVARQSTATFVTTSPVITAAVVQLHQHFREPLQLAGMARQAGMSERTFRLEFKRHVGRSAREELLRVRVAGAAVLLRDTNLKLEAIAAESGFRSASRLCEAFVEIHGASPTVWRQQVKVF